MEEDLFKVVWAISGKEVTPEDLEHIALTHKWAKGLVYCDMEGFAIAQDGILLVLDQCGSHRYPPEGLFRIEWSPNVTANPA